MKDVNKEIEEIVNWIKETVLSAKAKGVILGLSGGIDSAVAAALCKKAFPDNTLCLIMPCHSDNSDAEDAGIIADKLKLDTKKVELDTIYDSFIKQVGSDSDDLKFILGNIKSRLRMITLYYFAAKYNYLVVGPTNKSEFAIGYFTKHGDSGVDMMPIVSYVKHEIYELARNLGIPKIIIDKIPTAGLWPGQTDESEMEMSYEELDKFITLNHGEESIIKKIEKKIQKSEHKRKFPEMFKRV